MTCGVCLLHVIHGRMTKYPWPSGARRSELTWSTASGRSPLYLTELLSVWSSDIGCWKFVFSGLFPLYGQSESNTVWRRQCTYYPKVLHYPGLFTYEMGAENVLLTVCNLRLWVHNVSITSQIKDNRVGRSEMVRSLLDQVLDLVSCWSDTRRLIVGLWHEWLDNMQKAG